MDVDHFLSDISPHLLGHFHTDIYPLIHSRQIFNMQAKVKNLLQKLFVFFEKKIN